MIDAGEPVTFPAVARRAGVSVSLLYADSELAGRLSKARSRQRDAGADRAWRLPARSLVSEQSLRADLAKQQNPKDHWTTRHYAASVATLEDKIVQRAVAGVLNAVYEADFLGFSFTGSGRAVARTRRWMPRWPDLPARPGPRWSTWLPWASRYRCSRWCG